LSRTPRTTWAALLAGGLLAGASCTLEQVEVAPPGAEAGAHDDGAEGDGDEYADVTCGDGRTACQGACFDLLTDPEHCGSCSASCGTRGSCVDGECLCDTGHTACPSGCTRLDNDPLNCGRCALACPEGSTCRRSICEPG
jgi:hypothetical protein